MQSRIVFSALFRPLALGAALAVLAAPLASPPTPVIAASNWQVQVGASRNDEAVQFEVYLAPDVTIDVGDSITWTIKSGESHSVTFCAPPSSNPFAPSGDATHSGCDDTDSSGLIGEGDDYSLTFPAEGDFDYFCVIHPAMTGKVHVNASGTAYPHNQRFYDNQSQKRLTTLRRKGDNFLKLGSHPGPNQVTAGIGDGTIDVMRFQPDSIKIRVGQSVTWTNRGTGDGAPHTITFGVEPGNPAQTVGLSGDGEAIIDSHSDSVSSGFIGPSPDWNGKKFKVTFQTSGTFNYICALHDELGMVGKVIVSP